MWWTQLLYYYLFCERCKSLLWWLRPNHGVVLLSCLYCNYCKGDLKKYFADVLYGQPLISTPFSTHLGLEDFFEPLLHLRLRETFHLSLLAPHDAPPGEEICRTPCAPVPPAYVPLTSIWRLPGAPVARWAPVRPPDGAHRPPPVSERGRRAMNALRRPGTPYRSEGSSGKRNFNELLLAVAESKGEGSESAGQGILDES